ncbi:MAG: alpha/beta family hydrolase [Terrimesophilobacter sp.]
MDVTVPTPRGPGRLVVQPADAPAAVLWLGHGAGGGIEARDLAALAGRLPGRGITVIRYEQPWRVAGRRVAPPPATLDAAWGDAATLVRELAGGLPLVVGGRSAGARVACRTAVITAAVAVVCLAFPLHPPGKPKSRLAELLLPQVPVLVLQGERDTFGTAAELAAELETDAAGTGRIRVVAVPGADHGMKVLKSSPFDDEGVATLLTSHVGDFVSEVALA